LTEDLFCISNAALRFCNTKGTAHPVATFGACALTCDSTDE
jgi:hypothetical protein